MEVRGIVFDDLARRVMGVVNAVNHQLVRAPPGARSVGGITVDLPEARPPTRLRVLIVALRLPTLVFLLYQKGRDSRIFQAQDGYPRTAWSRLAPTWVATSIDNRRLL